jgi:hypothetical protein
LKTPIRQKTSLRHVRSLGLALALVVLLGSMYAIVLNMPTRVYEASDFLGYWAAANLLAHGQSPYDHTSMLALEQSQGWAGDDPVYSWNPPWLHVLLLPLGVLPFRPAAALWFVIGPLVIGTSILLLWDTLGKRKHALGLVAALLIAFLFSPTLHAILEGQVNTLILLGCAGFIALSIRRRDTLAGAALVLVTVKPHISYLLVPAILLVCLLRGRWRILLGFVGFLVSLLVVATCLHPGWAEAYLVLFDVVASPLGATTYTTPTVRGVLGACLGIDIGIWPSLACLVIFLVFVWLRGRRTDLADVASLSLLLGLPTAPFGWSTDQVVLLVPVLQAVLWSLDSLAVHRRTVVLSLLLTYAYAALVWLVSYRDVAFAAVPPMIGLLWGYVRGRASVHPLGRAATPFGGRQPVNE